MTTPSFDLPSGPTARTPVPGGATDPEMQAGALGDLLAVVDLLAAVSCGDDPGRIDALRVLEQISCAAAGAQARITAEFSDSQRAAQQAAQTAQQATGVPVRDLGRGIGAQVGLARRESPHRGGQHLGLALALREMPHTAAALSAGEITEWRATLVTRETACLSRADRAQVDTELAARPGGLTSLGDRATEVETRRISYRLDPYAFTRRAVRAETNRRVTVRPAPDTMSIVTGLLPMKQGVALYAALTRHADSLRSHGDPRTRSQIMADTLVERVTGQTTASAVPVEVSLVMTDRALLVQDDVPGDVEGFGPVPAPFARQWLTDPDTSVSLRRLFTDPTGQRLVAMDSVRRVFTGGLRRFITLRDRQCRTPWCDAPIRHIDHPHRATDGGPTTATNSQGLCEACNHTKEAPGWHAHTAGDAGDAVHTRTPTGHHHTSRPPPPITAVPHAAGPPARIPPRPRNGPKMDIYVGTLLHLTA